MLNCQISAPGKVILHGEHSVVYGRTALVASINLRTNLYLIEKARTNDEDTIKLSFPNLQLEQNIPLNHINKLLNNSNNNHDVLLSEVKDFVYSNFNKEEANKNNTLTAVFYVMCLAFKKVSKNSIYNPFEIEVKTELTIGGGSGSSAAFGVCIATAFLILSKYMTFENLDQKVISELAFESERIMHSNPSGVDNTICTYGGLLSFTKTGGFEQIDLNQNMNLNILLVDTNVNRITANLVQKVGQLHKKFENLTNTIFDAMELVVQEAKERYSSGSGSFLDCEQLFDINNGLLRAIGVSHPSLEEIFQISMKNGFSCKLTGAGGGGYAIILLQQDYIESEKFKILISELNNSGFKTIETKIGGEGVRIENL